jgi:hypothetical protein
LDNCGTRWFNAKNKGKASHHVAYLGVTRMARSPEKVFRSEEEKLAIVMWANAAVQQALLMATVL